MLTRRRLLGLGGLTAAGVAGSALAAEGGRVREHWIAARPARWPVTAGGHHGGGRREWLDALVYVGCTPRWGRPLPAGGIGDNTGIPGPVLRAQPGDLLRVHFRDDGGRTAPPRTARSSAPRRASGSAGRRTSSGGGSTTATCRATCTTAWRGSTTSCRGSRPPTVLGMDDARRVVQTAHAPQGGAHTSNEA